MFIGATIVHVLVLGSYLSTEFSELWAAPEERHEIKKKLDPQTYHATWDLHFLSTKHGN